MSVDERALAVSLFNRAWELLGTEARTVEEDDELVHAAHTSRFLWGRVGGPANWARGEWQCSRVYATLGRAQPALHHARRCLDLCREHGLGDFDVAYAYEALSRGYAVAGERGEAERWRDRARLALPGIADEEDREHTEEDLATLDEAIARGGRFVPGDFDVPERLETDRFVLRMLSVDDVDLDFAAINARVLPDGTPDPWSETTLRTNLADLGWHETEFRTRRSFTYTVVAPDESEVVGCVYLYPVAEPAIDARVLLWVTGPAWEQGLDGELEQAVREWVERDWPFGRVVFPGRDELRDAGERVAELVAEHPAVNSVRLVGSRAEGRAHALSDWDLFVETDAFEAVAAALPGLLAPLDPLAAQWDRLSEEATYYMLVLPGALKVDLVFDRPPRLEPPWEVRADTLAALDAHFWDWLLWLGGKQLAGDAELARSFLGGLMHEHLLDPLGVAEAPATLPDAAERYLAARADRERELGVEVDRRLGDAVTARLRSAGLL